MTFCTNCGSEISEGSSFCSACGQPVVEAVQTPVAQQTEYYDNQPVQKPEGKALAICALVFSILLPFVGLVLGIIGVATSKDESNKKMSIIALVIAGVLIVLTIVFCSMIFRMVTSPLYNPSYWY
ncbi:MAG: zinc-ribbon domain-containing protein [Pseudobutyrivibrio sp.]|nr:zinc-ribbon domain-containing protein [Pseudobutyrivibrio sp.]